MGNKEQIILEGLAIPFQNKNNLNGRRYSKDSFSEKAIESMKNVKWGEYGMGGTEINMMKLSHRVIDSEITDEGLKAKIELLDTLEGEKIKKLLEYGVKLSLASRGIGTVDSSSLCHLDNIISYDIVNESSFPDNFLKRLYF